MSDLEDDFDEAFRQPEDAEAAPTGGVKFLSTAEFLDGFELPAYTFDGIMLRGNLYSCTGKTGAGKTSAALALAFMKETGTGKLNGAPVERGKVCYFAAENPDDVRMRALLMCDRLGLDYKRLGIQWVAGAFDLEAGLEEARQRASDAELIIVDTGAAFALQSGATEENDNSGQLRFAKQLRALTELENKPTVLVLMHPTKHAASQDQLLPRGGGSFIAEVDGNLTLWTEGTVAELHHTGKLRGPDFNPISFILEPGSCPALTDAKGRQIPSVWAYPADGATIERAANQQRTDEDNLLRIMQEAPGSSLAALCGFAGWIGATGHPQKSRAAAAMNRLAAERLVEKVRNHWSLTVKGERELKKPPAAVAPHPAEGVLRKFKKAS